MSNSEKLLTEKDRDTCQQIAASEAGLASQRAAALLAIDQGSTRGQASEQTGLTSGQIGYLLRVFQQKRLAIFPDTKPIEEEKVQPPTEPAKPEAKADKPKEDKKGKKAKAKKPKKGKKGKEKKRVKKPKKGKKAKAKKAKKDKESKKDKAAKKKSKK
jgi:hypothetical protein